MNRSALIEAFLGDLKTIRRSVGFPGISDEKSGITGSQWGVVFLLSRERDMTVKRVAESLGITSSAATQLIDALVKAGHINRAEDEADRRVTHLTLSKKTAQRIAEMKASYINRLTAVFASLNDAEFKHYMALNKKIAAALPKQQH